MAVRAPGLPLRTLHLKRNRLKGRNSCNGLRELHGAKSFSVQARLILLMAPGCQQTQAASLRASCPLISAMPREPQDAPRFEEMKIATKRRKRRIKIRFLCFLCLFVAHDSVFNLAA